MSAADTPPRRAQRDDARYGRKSQQSTPRQEGYTSSLYEEFSRLHVQVDREFQETLDQQLAEQEKLHLEALAQAAAEHARVRQGAERARELLELEIEKERARREQDETRQLEAERKARNDREAAELTRQRKELERQQEEQRKRAAEEHEIQAARAQLEEHQRRERDDAERRQTEQAEARKTAQAEAEAKAKGEADRQAAEKAATPHPPPVKSAPTAAPPATNGTQPTTASTSHAHPPAVSQPARAPANGGTSAAHPISANPLLDPGKRQQREELHARYLALHKKLKAMREYVYKETRNMPALKKELGDWKRKITQSFGQLTTEKLGHQRPLKEIVAVLTAAQKFPEPSVDISSYIISSPTPGTPMPISGPLLFLLNTVAKSAISQMSNSASSVPDLATPIAIVALTVFAKPDFQYAAQIPLIDILLAKFRFACPVLWGIYGDERTPSGRLRMGWARLDGAWVPEQRHIERMAGLGAGYAALALRDFSKSSLTNPYPPRNYWRSLSLIANVPPAEAQPTHFIVLKALIVVSIPGFVRFYGQAAVVALRKALVEFPAGAPRSSARDAVVLMQETLRRDLKLVL